jgi:2',3'-cyclic-nucleotide 2'-phosphodiesterase (5'-nucleotidase family)
MIDSRKLLLFIIGIMFGAALGVGTYVVLTDQQQLNDIIQYQAQIQSLNEIIDEKEASLTQLEQDQQALLQEINQLRGQLEQLTQQQDTPETPQGPTDITIFHINDLHGRVLSQDPQDGMVGGITKIAYIINQERETGANVIFLNAGDSNYGTILTNYYEGIPTVESMNSADLDAMVIGNHEYDFGLEPLIEAWSTSDYPWLGANIIETSTGTNPEYLQQYVLMEVGGIDVAILGFFDFAGIAGARYQEIRSLDFQFSHDFADTLLSELDSESDLIIAVTHIGYNGDVSLAENTDGIDVIVGGHSHSMLAEPEYVDGTVIVQAWNHGLVLGRLDITVDDDEVIAYSGELIPITADIPDDPDVSAALQPYVDEYRPIMNEVVGVTLVDLNADAEALRGQDTNAGNLVADALLWEAGDADIAIHNSGGFRWKRVFPAGEITRADAHELLPFQNSLIVAEFTGEQIRQELEYCADGGWMQVAGVRFTYDTSLPANERVVEAYVGGEPLDDSGVYKVAMGAFIAGGGSGHWPLTQGQNYNDLGIFLADCLVNYLKEFSPVSPIADGRITAIQ